ncbi:MAG: hypothetical protein ACK4G5_11125 [Devosia sp.]
MDIADGVDHGRCFDFQAPPLNRQNCFGPTAKKTKHQAMQPEVTFRPATAYPALLANVEMGMILFVRRWSWIFCKNRARASI